jgi:hypothetical protein
LGRAEGCDSGREGESAMTGYWDRFLKYIKGGPEAIDGWPRPIPIEVFNQAIARTLGVALSEKGFETVAPRRWVRSTRTPIRDLLEIQAGKGVGYSPMWGFSLDFVPHVTTSGEIKWHRTAKSARFDLEYRPTEYAPLASETREWDISPVATPEELQVDLSRVTRLIMAHAIPFWERVRGIEDLPTAYREQRIRQSANLPFVSYRQQALASAFVLAKSSDAAGRAELAEYIRANDVDPETAKKLEELLEQTMA